MPVPTSPAETSAASGTPVFVDRRKAEAGSPTRERRQFANSYDDLSADGAELARAIDGYKLQHRRRFINADELLTVIRELGYAK